MGVKRIVAYSTFILLGILFLIIVPTAKHKTMDLSSMLPRDVGDRANPKLQYEQYNALKTQGDGTDKTKVTIDISKNVYVKGSYVDILWVAEGEPKGEIKNMVDIVTDASSFGDKIEEAKEALQGTIRPYEDGSNIISPIQGKFANSSATSKKSVDFYNSDGETVDCIEVEAPNGDIIQFIDVKCWFGAIGRGEENYKYDDGIVVGKGGYPGTDIAPAGGIIGIAKKNTAVRVIRGNKSNISRKYIDLDKWYKEMDKPGGKSTSIF